MGMAESWKMRVNVTFMSCIDDIDEMPVRVALDMSCQPDLMYNQASAYVTCMNLSQNQVVK